MSCALDVGTVPPAEAGTPCREILRVPSRCDGVAFLDLAPSSPVAFWGQTSRDVPARHGDDGLGILGPMESGPRPRREPRTPSRTNDPDVILLAVTGMSPAILTETIWALAHEAEPILPTRVIAVTTTEGRAQLERLFAATPELGGQSPWAALREALMAEGHDLAGRLRFGTTGDDIRVMTRADAATGATRELADIRGPQDNDAAASFLLEQVRGLVANPDVAVVGSIAGGRKTMGALLYACFTLAARETDRLTHVLVSPPYETLPGFWFPTQPGPLLRGRDGEERPASRAMVELADVPFVPISNLFQRELGRAPGGFERLVDQCRTEVRQRSSEHLQVTVDARLARLDLNGQAVDLAPREHLLLLFLAYRCKHGGEPILAYRDAMDPLNAFRSEMRRQADPKDFNDARHGDTFQRPFEEDLEVRRALSSLKRKLAAIGPNGARLAALLPERGRFLLDLPGAQVRIR